MHPDSTAIRPPPGQGQPASLPACICALLAQIGHGSHAAPAAPAASDGACHLSHLGALDLLEQHRCVGEWCYGRIEDIAPGRFPLILRCKDGSYCVLLVPPHGGRVPAVFPAWSLPLDCLCSALQAAHGGLYLLCTPRQEARRDACTHTGLDWCFGALDLAHS